MIVAWPATDLGSLGFEGTTMRSSRQSAVTVVDPAEGARCVAATKRPRDPHAAATAPVKLHWQDRPAAAAVSKMRTIHPGGRT